MKQGRRLLVGSIAPARSEAKLSRSRKNVRRHHRQPLPGRARRQFSHAVTDIRAAFGARHAFNRRVRDRIRTATRCLLWVRPN